MSLDLIDRAALIAVVEDQTYADPITLEDHGWNDGITEALRLVLAAPRAATEPAAREHEAYLMGIEDRRNAERWVAPRAATEPHTHHAEYPSKCTGCEHLAADLVSRAPAWMLTPTSAPEPGS